MNASTTSLDPRGADRWLRTPATALLAILFAAAIHVPAQAGPVHYGLRGGVNLATVRGDFADIVDPKIQPGLTAGGFATLSLMPKFELEVDALYVRKGFKLEVLGADDAGNPINEEDHLRLDYIDVPVLARLSLPSWGVVSAYLVAGPNIAFGLKAKGEVSGGLEEDFTSDMKKVVFGANGGLGLKLGTGPVSFGVESRYSTDFGDLWDQEGNAESINEGVSITAWLSR